MSPRAARSAKSPLAAALRAAGFTPRPLEDGGPPHGFALEGPGPAGAAGAEALALTEDHGATLAVRVPLPPACEMAGLAPAAERALRLLGAMMLGLQAQGLQVSPVARYQGMEALLLTLHVCAPLEAEAVRAGFERLFRTARALAPALAEPEGRILMALRQATGVRGVLAAAEGRRGAVMVPSFDEGTAGAPARRRPRHGGR